MALLLVNGRRSALTAPAPTSTHNHILPCHSCPLSTPPRADNDGSTTLIADLGCLRLNSNRELLAMLSSEEAGVYECFHARIDHVSAYLLDGPFAWPGADDVSDAAAAAAAGGVREGVGRQVRSSLRLHAWHAMNSAPQGVGAARTLSKQALFTCAWMRAACFSKLA